MLAEVSREAYTYWFAVISKAVQECGKRKAHLEDLLYSEEIGSTFNVTENFWLSSKHVSLVDRQRIPYIMLDDITELLASVHHDHGEKVLYCLRLSKNINFHGNPLTSNGAA